MSKIEINIWGRDFSLPVDYECYVGETIIPIQKEAFEKLIQHKAELLEDSSAIKEYCLKKNGSDIQENEIRNIFRYVIPSGIYVLRDSEKRSVALMCNYRFDMEHGIALLFENEKLKKIGQQDMVL